MDSDAADASEVPNHDQFPSIEDNSWYYNHSSLKPFNPLDQVEFGNVLNYDNPVSDGRFDEDEDETGENGSTEDTGTSQSQYESRIMLGDPGGAESKPSIKLVVKRKFPLVNNGEEPSGSKARLDSHQPGQSLASKQEVEDSQRENSRFASLTKKLDMEEWRKLSSQLKMADRIGNAIRLCEVLRICIKSDVSVELLKSNDTAKFVKKLARNSFNPDIKQLGQQLVTKWKDVIESSALADCSSGQKSANDEDAGGNEVAVDKKSAAKRPMASLVNEDIFGPAPSKLAKKKDRPKTAKVPPVKFRSTGLEGEESAPSSSTAAPKRKPEAVGVKSGAATVPAKKVSPSSVNSKRAMLSTGFMDDLRGQVAQKKVVKPQQKMKPNRPEIVPAPIMSGRSSTTNSGSPRNEEALSPEHIEPGRRRVHFADDKGKELVAVRYFEIEAGERVNVHKLSAEELKHFEMKDERSHLRHQHASAEHVSQIWGQEAASKASMPWRLHQVECEEPVAVVCNSEALKEEKERQRYVMAVFVDPSVPMNIAGEPDPEDPKRDIPGLTKYTRTIPLNPLDEDEDDAQNGEQENVAEKNLERTPSEASPMVTPEIQTIMDQLRQSGAVASLINQSSQPAAHKPSNTMMSDIADIMSKVNKSTAAQLGKADGIYVAQAPQTTYVPQPSHTAASSSVGSIPTIPTQHNQSSVASSYQSVQPQMYQPQQPSQSTNTSYYQATQVPVIPSIPTVPTTKAPQTFENSPQSPPRHEPPGGPGPSSTNDIAILNNFDVHGGPLVEHRPPGDEHYVDNYPPSGHDGYPTNNGPLPAGGRQCIYFQRGNCHFNENCMNLHGDIRTVGSMGGSGNYRGRGRGAFPGRGGFAGRGGRPPGPPEYDSRRMRGRSDRSPPPRRHERPRYGDRYRPRSRSRSYSPSRRRSRSPDRSRRYRRSPPRGSRSPRRPGPHSPRNDQDYSPRNDPVVVIPS